jgi:hypothetical protein
VSVDPNKGAEMVSCRLVGTGALVIRSDRESRGFVIPEDDLDEALTGGIGAVLLLDQTATVAIARLSQSGLALHIVIDKQLHTVPMRLLTPVLTGHHRKAPLFRAG